KGKYLAAYLVPKGEASNVVKDLRGFLAKHLPSYMMPSVFTVLRELPLMPNGKLDRRSLPQPAAMTDKTPDNYAPRSRLEEELMQIWTNVLGLERIGINENLFELGGTSLMSVVISSEISKKLAVRLAPIDVFQHPSIAELSEFLSQRNDSLRANEA